MEDMEFMCTFEQYVKSACDEIQEYVKGETVRVDIPEDLLVLLDNFPAKFKFVLFNHVGPYYELPVLTQSPLQVLAKHLARIPEALNEACTLNV